MEERKVEGILLKILYSVLNEGTASAPLQEELTPEILAALYSLAKKHDVAHIVSIFLYQNGVETPSELRKKFQQEELMSVYRCEQMNYNFQEICGVFSAANIPYIPLKGSVLRPYYPEESMRTSCDIDILIHETDLETAIAGLEKVGYTCGERNYHDVSLYSADNMHLELHFTIQEHMENLDAVLCDAWEHAVQKEGSRYEFTKGFFAFHIFAHMAYHFLSGGCGIRSLVDIWVMNRKMGITYECAEKLLKKADIYQFAVEMSALAERCFTEGEENAFSDTVLKYIFAGGVYGSRENHITVDKSKKKSTFHYLMAKLFLPYRSMVEIYPILKKVPILLPFCWVARWIRAVFRGRSKRILSEVSYANKLSEEKTGEMKEVLSRLGM